MFKLIFSCPTPSKSGVQIPLVALLLLSLSGCVTVNSNQSGKPDSEEIFKLAADADRAYVESRWLDAAREYQRLADLVPEDPYAWFRLGNTYAQQGSFNQAISAYQASIKRNPNQPKPWYNLATAHLLNAQDALRKSYGQLRADDPARMLIAEQLSSLESIIYQRVEDISHNTGNTIQY